MVVSTVQAEGAISDHCLFHANVLHGLGARTPFIARASAYLEAHIFRKNSGHPESKKSPVSCFQDTGRKPGDDLLSHNLEMHYHRLCSVSLPCSGWERVVPPRYGHQKRSTGAGSRIRQVPRLRRPSWQAVRQCN